MLPEQVQGLIVARWADTVGTTPQPTSLDRAGSPVGTGPATRSASQHPHVGVIVLSQHADGSYADALLANGPTDWPTCSKSAAGSMRPSRNATVHRSVRIHESPLVAEWRRERRHLRLCRRR